MKVSFWSGILRTLGLFQLIEVIGPSVLYKLRQEQERPPKTESRMQIGRRNAECG